MDKLIEEYDNNSSELIELEYLQEKYKIVFASNVQSLPLLSVIGDNDIGTIEQNEIGTRK